MKKLAPIVVFTYVRVEKLKKSIETLKQCDLSKKSHLYIFSDSYKKYWIKLGNILSQLKVF